MRSITKTVYGAVVLFVSAFFITSASAEAQEFSIRGRLHMDGFYGISQADTFSNGFNNRRARMGMAGTITNGWDGQIEIDFADGRIDPKDIRLRRTFGNGGQLWIGQYKVPQGLNQLTSSNEITLVERSAINNVIADSRRLGIAWDYFNGPLGFKTMIFGRALGQRDALIDDMPLGLAFRGVFAPETGGGILHIGASAVYENLMDNNIVRLRDRPEARDSKGGDIRLIDAVVPDAKSTFKAGLELLFISGPFSIEGEYLQATVNRSEGNNPTFGGFHVQSSYVLTGESRSYSRGLVGSVSPAGDAGAWEVALRYSFMDLNDAGFTGGVQRNITLGLNHYITSRLRFMGNVVFVNVDYLDENPALLVVRAQFSF
jgi:phosphate-selective porin OprO and OprP